MPSVTLAFSVFWAIEAVICSIEALVSSTLAACSLEACDRACEVADSCSAALASELADSRTSEIVEDSRSTVSLQLCFNSPKVPL